MKRWTPVAELLRMRVGDQSVQRWPGAATHFAQVLDAIRERVLKQGERVYVPGFGVFYRATRKARAIRHPRNGSTLVIPETVSLGFKAAKGTKR